MWGRRGGYLRFDRDGNRLLLGLDDGESRVIYR